MAFLGQGWYRIYEKGHGDEVRVEWRDGFSFNISGNDKLSLSPNLKEQVGDIDLGELERKFANDNYAIVKTLEPGWYQIFDSVKDRYGHRRHVIRQECVFSIDEELRVKMSSRLRNEAGDMDLKDLQQRYMADGLYISKVLGPGSYQILILGCNEIGLPEWQKCEGCTFEVDEHLNLTMSPALSESTGDVNLSELMRQYSSSGYYTISKADVTT